MGYLPDYPYYLISDEEMFDAFLREGGFFETYYPCPEDSLREAYDLLADCIKTKIQDYLTDGTALPNWVYSYMIMNPITYQSSEADIEYICEMANIDIPNGLPEFNAEVAEACYDISKKWIQKQPSRFQDRPPTMFGEAHVIKSLRLDQANVLLD